MRWKVVGGEAREAAIDLGCGKDRKSGVWGVDVRFDVRPDVVADLERGLPFKDNSIHYVYANHVLEHTQNLEGVMSEIHRILRPDGCLRLFVPHFSNPFGYSDYTHRRFFGSFSFSYFVPWDRQNRWRQVPNYALTFPFRLTYERLRFYSPLRLALPFVFLLELLVNSSTFARILYEYHFCYWFPIYGIKVELRPLGKKE
jgi:ubiquinone/menaquinone biosynthesis C-methylase UbiE